MKRYYVYILRCQDGTYYTKMTSDLEQRISQHQSGVYTDSSTQSTVKRKRNGIIESQNHSYTIVV